MTRENFDLQLAHIKEKLVNLATMVNKQQEQAVKALADRDEELAKELIASDVMINQAQREIEETCLLLIASQQPVARDLRLIFSISMIASELERMADHAKGIAILTQRMADQPLLKPLIDVPRMAEIGREMLMGQIDAFIRCDVETARRMAERDAEVDQLNAEVFRELLVIMMADPRTINRATYLLWVAHNLERFADRTTNIGERVIFLQTNMVVELNAQGVTAMDLTQLSQMVAWLDEEHRRDREEIARLDQRLQSMAIEKQEQSRRIQDLESRLASTQAQLTRFPQIEQALQQFKGEVVVLLDKQVEARLTAERDSERARVSDRDALGRGIAEVRKELTRIMRIEEDLVTRQAEDQRLGEMLLAQRVSLSNVTKDLDERTRTLPYMVEQRAQDNKRIAQLQADNTELLKRTEAVGARIPVLEERLQRLDKDLQRIQPIPDQLQQDQKTFIEAQKIGEVERNRQMGIWEQEFAEQKTLIEKQIVRLREFEARYEQVGRALKAVEEFQSLVVRDQKQVAELQRLAEERQRKELTDWQGENEQRWKKESLRWDHSIQEQQKANQKLGERFPPLERQLALYQREIEALWRLHEALGVAQAQSSQRLMDAIGAAVGARPKPGA